MLPQARREGLRVERIGETLVVHDPARNRTHPLHPVAALLWRHCDGRTSLAELARRLQDELGVPAGEERVWQELEHLEAAGLLREPLRRPEHAPAITRRAMVGVLGRASALLLVAPAYLASQGRTQPLLRVGTSHPEPDRELRDVFVEGGFVVPEGKVWKVGPNVRTNGNVVVHGQLVMRPGAGLKFQGADPERFVGGGHGFRPAVQHDLGLWVEKSGLLDIQGTPKTGWNRTGRDPTWNSRDEYWIAPTARGDYRPRRWQPGQPIPRVHASVPPAEIANVTRDIVIEGPGHIHIGSHRPQRIEYVRLEGLGISRASSNGPVLGRYALHLHRGMNGTRDTLIRGVAAVNSRGRVFVPHEAHGIRMIDNVSVNSFAEALWWDIGDRTDDCQVDRLLVLGVSMPSRISRSGFAATVLGGGNRNVITRSVVAGAHGRRHSHGFDWPSKVDDHGPALWHFGDSWEEANVAHNNQGDGVRIWLKAAPHATSHFITYRHGGSGVNTGRYRGASRYHDALLIDDHIHQNASTSARGQPDGRGTFYDRVRVHNSSGPAVVLGNQNLPGRAPHEFVDCTLEAGAGHPKVRVGRSSKHPFLARFVRCDLTPADIEWPQPAHRPLAGSRVYIEHEDGRRWEITLDSRNLSRVVHELERVQAGAG